MSNNQNAAEPPNGTVAAQDGQQEVANGNAAQQQQQQQRPDGWSMVKGFIIRLVIIYFISSLFRRGQQPAPSAGPDGAPVSSGPRPPSTNMFPKGASLDLYVFLSDSERFTDFNNSDALFWKKTGLIYGDWESGEGQDGVHAYKGQIRTPARVIQNTSMHMHLFFVRSGKSPDPAHRLYSKKYTIHRSKVITKMKKRKVSNTVNLLTGVTDGPTIPKNINASDYLPPVVHWHPNMTINLMDDHTQWVEGSIPSPLNEFIEFYPASGEYYPVVFFNDYWNLHSDYQPVNETTPFLNFTVTYQPISLIRWQLYAGMTMRNKMYGNLFGTDLLQESDDDQDALKKTLIETNPYLLAMTIVVSLLHSVFEFLAFKNDIQFWRSRESLKGLSVRSVFFNVFQSVIVVLYVLDNDTNFVVRVSVVIGLLIEIWKIKKVVNFTVDRSRRILGVFPRIWFQDKSSYSESETKKFDEMAYRYLSWLLFPMLGVYAVYSLLYVEHKSWYSWVLSMMYGFLLTFGFIMMTPQLFINYKMKSVAHLPWRMLTYKALNTFIDDIFAFVIRMPTLYRIGCLRDDVIFFIYLYQRYIYPIDPKRMNEFGTSQEMLQTPELPPGEEDAAATGAAGPAGEDEEDKKTK